MTTGINQLRSAVTAGHRATLLGTHLRNDEPLQAEVPDDISLHSFEARPWLAKLPVSSLFSLRFAIGTVRLVRSADVVHISVARDLAVIWTMLVCVVLRRPVIAQPHGMLRQDSRLATNLVDALALRPLVRRAQRIVCLTTTETAHVRAWLRRDGRTVTIGNGVDSQQLREVASRETNHHADEVLFIARLAPRKRVDVFCNAARSAVMRNLAGNYVVVGPDSGSLRIVRETAQTLPADRFSYEGALPPSAIIHRLAHARVFALTSYEEPWGVVLVQALGLGIPVALTRSSALAPLVDHFGAGVLVDDGDPDALAQAVHALLTDEQQYASCCRAALRLAEEHLDRNTINEALLETYQTVGSAHDA